MPDPSIWRKLRRRPDIRELEPLRQEFELHMVQALVDEGVPEEKARHDVARSNGAWSRDTGSWDIGSWDIGSWDIGSLDTGKRQR